MLFWGTTGAGLKGVDGEGRGTEDFLPPETVAGETATDTGGSTKALYCFFKLWLLSPVDWRGGGATEVPELRTI